MATKKQSSNNRAFDPHSNEPWTQESANGLLTKHAKARYRNYAFIGVVVAAAIISNIVRVGMEDFTSFTSFLDLKWGTLGRYLAFLAVALLGTHLVASLLSSTFSFHCHFCRKLIYASRQWICPYCDKQNELYTFLYNCGGWGASRNAPPAHRCPHCKEIIQLKFKAGKKMFSRFYSDTAPVPERNDTETKRDDTETFP